MVLRGLTGVCLTALVACIGAQSLTDIPSLPAGLRGFQPLHPLKDVDPACNGQMLCSGYESEEVSFLVNASNPSQGCIYGHVPSDGECDVPCRGVLHKRCECMSHGEAVGHIKKRGGVTMMFGLCFGVVGVCAGCCLSSALDISSGCSGTDLVAAPVEATELSQTRSRRVSLLTPEAERSASRLITDRPGAVARKRRILCQVFFVVFFLIWLAFAGFLLFFGAWLLFFQESIYYDGCSK